MAKPWAEVAASPGFQGLAPEAQEQARQSYFEQNVAPRVAPDQIENVRAHFNTDTALKAPAPVAAAPSAPAEPPAQPPSTLRRELMAPIGVAEQSLKLGSGIPAAIAGGVTYGVQGVRKAFGADVDPAESMRNVTDSMTYHPMTDSGKAVDAAVGSAVGAVTKPVGKLYDQATGAVEKVSPTAANVMREAPAAATAALGVLPLAGPAIGAAESGVASAARGAAAVKPLPAIAEGAPVRAPAEVAEAAGFKLRPTDKGSGMVARGAEKVAGSDEMRREFITHNSKRANELAAEDIGLKAGDVLSPKNLERAEKPHAKVYDEVRAIPKIAVDDEFRAAVAGVKKPSDVPEAPVVRKVKEQFANLSETTGAKIVNNLSELRSEARTNMRSDKASLKLKGEAQLKIADAFEDLLERQTAALNPELGGRFKEARRGFAKVNTVRDALRGQDIDAQKLRALALKNKGIDRNLKIIADTAENFPKLMRDPKRVPEEKGGLSVTTAASLFAAPHTAGASLLVPGAIKAGQAGLRKLLSRSTGRGGPPGALSDYLDRTPSETPKRVPVQREGVDFKETPGVVPSRAQTLAGDLQLAPDHVPNAQTFPAAPDRLTADVPAPIRGDIDFTPGQPLGAQLAPDFGFEAPTIGGVQYAAPSLADQLVGELTLAHPELADQLGLRLVAPQPNMLGAYTRNLSAPPGRAGKPRG